MTKVQSNLCFVFISFAGDRLTGRTRNR